MMSATGMNGRDSNLLRVGLSHSTQELNNTAVDDTAAVNGITRSDSLPDVCAIQGLHKYSDLQQDVNIDDFRQLILYEPIQEEGENDDDDTETDDKLKLSSNNIKDVCMSPKRSRKRDSAALFDITLGDLTEPDFAGFLTEKHSGKQWWCVLQDMHLCMFPSKDPDEVAYDVIIMPCCQITLDDRLLRTPVFRLTQSDMAPWVLVAKDTHCLKEWMNVLTVATTGGSFGATNKPPDKPTSKVAAKPQMFAIEEEEDDSVEEIPEEVQLTPLTSFSGEVCSQSIESSEFKNETVEVAETSNSSPASEVPPVLPTMTFNDDQDYGEDLYEPIVPNQGEEFEDDGFATDEFDSGSSDGEAASSNALASPQQGRKAKKKKFFKWLKKKSKKYKLFSSPEDGVTLAGYAQRLDNSTCTKRWLLIREGKLHCFKTIKDEEPEVIIVLDGTDIKVGDEEKNKMCVKVLKDGTIKFVLVAKSQKDLERWKTALKVESGFIKHGSPTSSGIYEEEEEGDYVMPTPSPGLQRTSFLSSSPPKDDCDGFGGHEDEEDLYMEVIPTSTTPASIPHSPSHEGLGPLPAIPPDLPPRPVKSEEVESDDESDYEVYEEVGTSLPHADKVNQWDDKEAKTNYEEEDLYLNDIGRREESESEVDLKDLQEKTDVEPMEDKKLVVKIEENKAKGPVSAGMEDGSILDSAITASSFLENSKPSLGRLNTRGTGKQTGAWCPKNNDKAQFLQLDLGDTIKMCAVATQGRADFVEDGGWYVKTYTVAYSKDGENWVNYKEFGIAKVFQGNTDAETTVTNHLKRAVNARYVRIKPQAWNNHIAMRIEVYKGEASSKLEAGIHKLAATLTKAGKGKTFDKQLTSPTETLATKSNGVDEIASPTEKSPLASRVSFDKYVCIIGAEQSTEETKQEQQSAREDEDDKKASREELDVETKVQQNIKEFKQAEGGVKQSISRAEAPGSILAKRNLYENGNQSSSETKGGETKKNVKSGSTTLEKNADKTDTTTTSVSVTATDREREMLEKTEQVFQDYAKKLKSDGTPLKEKRPSIVAMQKMNFESPLVGKESKSQTRNQTPAKCQELLKEKAELTTKLEALKRRVAIAKDRKVFFGRSDGKNTAAAAADKELQSAQTELTKTKERLQAIESEAKNVKVLELRYQKTTVDNFSKKPAPLIRRNSREVKVGTLDCKPAPKVDSKNFNPDGQKAQRGSVLSQIKAFEKLKE